MEKNELKKYKNIIKQGLSIRESIDDVCFIIVERTLNNDWTFSYNGKIYQIPRQSNYPPARNKISLKITISGKIFVSYRDTSFSLF